MRLVENTQKYRGDDQLAIMAGWMAAPRHRSIEAEAMELADIAERDHAVRVIYSRRGVR